MRPMSITYKPTATRPSVVSVASQLHPIAWMIGVPAIVPTPTVAAVTKIYGHAFIRHPTASPSTIVTTSPKTKSALAFQPLRDSRHFPSRIKPAASASMSMGCMMATLSMMQRRVAIQPC